jgi:hypothetical protein
METLLYRPSESPSTGWKARVNQSWRAVLCLEMRRERRPHQCGRSLIPQMAVKPSDHEPVNLA